MKGENHRAQSADILWRVGLKDGTKVLLVADRDTGAHGGGGDGTVEAAKGLLTVQSHHFLHGLCGDPDRGLQVPSG